HEVGMIGQGGRTPTDVRGLEQSANPECEIIGLRRIASEGHGLFDQLDMSAGVRLGLVACARIVDEQLMKSRSKVHETCRPPGRADLSSATTGYGRASRRAIAGPARRGVSPGCSAPG